jgi:hypothetical protein
MLDMKEKINTLGFVEMQVLPLHDQFVIVELALTYENL